MLVLVLCIISVTSAFTQCVEVKGVESKKVCYDNCDSKNYDQDYGFEFVNLNKYQVSIEVELWWKGDDNNKERITQTKTFVIEAGETYVWKTNLGILPYRGGCETCQDANYVKFKTFKCP